MNKPASRSLKDARETLNALMAQPTPQAPGLQPLEPQGKARKKFDLKGLLTGGV